MPPPSLLALARSVGVPQNYFRGRSHLESCVPNNVVMFCREARTELQRSTFELRPHHRFVVIFNLETAGVVRIDGVSRHLPPDHGLMILPFQFHTFPETEQERITWLIVTFECDRPDVLEAFRGRIFPIDAVTRGWLTSAAQRYRAASEEANNQLLALEIASILAHLRSQVRRADIPRTTTDRRDRQLLDDIDAILRHSPESPPSIHDLAVKLRISESHLRGRFQAAFGTTIGAYIRNYRLHLVIAQMQDTRRNLTEIANAVGFADSSTFTRFFRSQLKMTPTAFRRTLQAK